MMKAKDKLRGYGLSNNNPLFFWKKKGIIVAAPGQYNEFLFWREANVIRRYLLYEGPHSFPQNFFWRILRGRGGLLSFGVNLRVQGLLSVDAFFSFRAKVYTDNFIKWIH